MAIIPIWIQGRVQPVSLWREITAIFGSEVLLRVHYCKQGRFIWAISSNFHLFERFHQTFIYLSDFISFIWEISFIWAISSNDFMKLGQVPIREAFVTGPPWESEGFFREGQQWCFQCGVEQWWNSSLTTSKVGERKFFYWNVDSKVSNFKPHGVVRFALTRSRIEAWIALIERTLCGGAMHHI